MTVVACRRPGGLELTDRLLTAVALPPGSAVLDVGCGEGESVAHMTDTYGLDATGVDSSPARIAQAAHVWPSLRFVVSQAEGLPFTDDSFDGVLCECVLSTIPVPGAALAEMARVLRPPGVVLVSDVYVRVGQETRSDGGVSALGRRETIEHLFGAAGLRVTLWSDASGALGRYVWDHVEGRAVGKVPASRRRAPAGARRLGYFICAARLETRSAKGASRG